MKTIMSAAIQEILTSNYPTHLFYNVKFVIFDSYVELFIFNNKYASYIKLGPRFYGFFVNIS